jgi:hypothetical protein
MAISPKNITRYLGKSFNSFPQSKNKRIRRETKIEQTIIRAWVSPGTQRPASDIIRAQK